MESREMSVYTDVVKFCCFHFSITQYLKSGEEDQIYYLDLLVFIYFFLLYTIRRKFGHTH